MRIPLMISLTNSEATSDLGKHRHSKLYMKIERSIDKGKGALFWSFSFDNNKGKLSFIGRSCV